MRKKDKIRDLHDQGMGIEGITIEANTTIAYVQHVLNEVNKKQIFEREKNKNMHIADEFLSTPVISSFANFILCTEDLNVLQAYEKMVNKT